MIDRTRGFLSWLLVIKSNQLFGYIAAFLFVFGVSSLLTPFRLQISITTIALSLLLAVLLIAVVWGSRQATLASVVGVMMLNYSFLPPVGTWTIADFENWIALVSFLIVALTTGNLSARLKRQAEEAKKDQTEIKRLYDELNLAFEKASQTEAIKRSEKLKSALLDAVTHDIRTPLTSIKASVTTLLDTTLGKSQMSKANLSDEMKQEMLEVINEETDRLNNFVEGMLELAKIEAGEMQFRLQWDSINEIIQAAINRAASFIKEHKIEVKSEKDIPSIRVDSRAVTEVLYTLIDNAVKYSPKGTKILIEAKKNVDSNIIIAVEDEGMGIPSELRDLVFGKFFRATRDGDTNSNFPSGKGVGLSIAKGIVEAHNGKIWIVEGIKKGTRFEFILPTGDEDESILI